MRTLLRSPTSTLSPSARILLQYIHTLAPDTLASVRICDLASGTMMHRNTIRSCLHCLEANRLITVERDGAHHALRIALKGCHHE
jgi:hypothetical protein